MLEQVFKENLTIRHHTHLTNICNFTELNQDMLLRTVN